MEELLLCKIISVITSVGFVVFFAMALGERSKRKQYERLCEILIKRIITIYKEIRTK